jgi:hypothetical protein
MSSGIIVSMFTRRICNCWQLAVSAWRKLYRPIAADERPTNYQWHVAATVGAPDSGGTCQPLASTDCTWIQLTPTPLQLQCTLSTTTPAAGASGPRMCYEGDVGDYDAG